MKLTKLINIFGWSCIFAGSALFFVPEDKPEVQVEQSEIDPYAKGKLCLKEMLYWEARGTSEREMQAILDVTLNRYRSAKYPDRICKVIKQPYQFSYLNGVENRETLLLPDIKNIESFLDKKAFLIIERIVEKRFNNSTILPNVILPYNAYWYHTKNLKRKPEWAKNLNKIVIKDFKHVFYKTSK